MNKITRTSLFIVAMFSVMPLAPALAQLPPGFGVEPAPGAIAQGPNFFIQLLIYVAQYVWTLFLIVAVIFYLWAAFMYLEARGDEEKIRRAKGALIWGVVAMAVAILAFSVRTLIQNFLACGGPFAC